MNWRVRITSGCVFQLFVASAIHAQLLTVSVTDPRPLAAAILALEHRHGWQINYEDPRYVWQGDIEDRTHPAYRGPGRALIPKPGRIDFSYPADSNTTAVIQRLLDAQLARGSGGVFELRQSGAVFSVVPISASDSRGQPARYLPVLDAPITLLSQQRTVLSALTEICSLVSQRTGTQVRVGTVPLNLFVQKQVQIGGSAPARDLLAHALQSTSRKLAWQLFHGAGSPDAFALNVHLVKMERQNPDGSRMLVEVR